MTTAFSFTNYHFLVMCEHEIAECFLSLTKKKKKELLQDIVWLFVFKVMPRIDWTLNLKKKLRNV